MTDWTAKVPPYESQYSASTHTDAEDCVEESICHIIYMLTGKRYSPRALAYLTDVTILGSRVQDCLDAIAKYGLLPYELWPTPDTFTWESYYAPIPQNLLLQAEYYDIAVIDPNLDKSPLWTELSFPGTNGEGSSFHLVAQINQTQYFDSELGSPIKPLNYGGAVVLWQSSILLTPKKMGQFKTQNFKGELRIVLEADSELTWEALCKVYGVDPKVITETIQ